MRIPFDSLTLAALVHELQSFVGAKVQRISQPNDTDVVFELYSNHGGVGFLLLSCHPEFSRAHLTTRKPGNPNDPPQFCTALRARIGVSRITNIRQVRFDRILEIGFDSPEGEFRLLAELMGKHSNLMLLDSGDRVVAAAKWFSRAKSSRPIQAGAKYSPPPHEARESLLRAKEGDELKGTEGASPFLLKLIDKIGLEAVQNAVANGEYHPVLVVDVGAYPLDVSPLGLQGIAKPTISLALEQHFNQAIPQSKADALRASLKSQAARVLLARETALHDLRQAQMAGKGAGRQQMMGDLILAFGHSLDEGADRLEVEDYEGKPISIKLDPEKDFKANANSYFEKAKKAKARLGFVGDQFERLSLDKTDLESFLVRLEGAERLRDVEALYDEAKAKKWLNKPPTPKAHKEERPYEGHRVRELLAPGGYRVLYGENAESNDYLTTRVAKPNDWWLHIRGSQSAHVVIQTLNQPDKVQRETLVYAAKVAVQNSPSKHAGYVPVDYTLKKYVRKPRGAKTGSAVYTHEKTLHVDS
jgi:predicted ribosome quality control (RQC) complex YloA/Tae2 family protein